MNGLRLRSVRKALNLSQQDFAESLNINASAISQMETNRIKPSLDTLLLLAKNYKVNLHWLLTGKGQMFEDAVTTTVYKTNNRLEELKKLLTEELNSITKAKLDFTQHDAIDIPVKGEIAAGQPVESFHDEIDVVTVRKSILQGTVNEFLCLRVNGKSMEPEIRHNDMILIRQSKEWEKLAGRICAVRIDGSITLKQLVLDPANQVIVLVSLNNDYQPIVIRPDEHQDIDLIGYLFFLFRKML
ncbi:MAG: helix-turn-helix domain-containing protein [Candidatus Cloacimonetes bacterium]|nr:helix-turn-helix domain-containing protein [Candidatus Cloacimonadota bacterium]